ncbi:MAG TPA: HDOD domain-containing protein [Bryobacteraceae bacterium]|nr:HDOD domain-containing protein [Bryobacteraceae bacterium]
MKSSVKQDVLIERALRSLNELPPFSPVLTTLMASLSSEDVSLPKLAAMIEKDIVLSGTMLRIVNSALYGRGATVSSVCRAITVMGLIKLRNTALGLSVNCIWKGVQTPAGWSMGRFNLHSLGTAILADQLAQRMPVSYPEDAFVSGLFHDLGKLVIATGLRPEHVQIARLLVLESDPLECERMVLGMTHADISAAALERWNLPKQVRDAVAIHHAPDLGNPELYDGCKFHIGHVVHIADRIANGIGVSLKLSPALSDAEELAEVEQVLNSVELSHLAPELLHDFHSEFDAMRMAA